jgi:hypothetical protein
VAGGDVDSLQRGYLHCCDPIFLAVLRSRADEVIYRLRSVGLSAPSRTRVTITPLISQSGVARLCNRSKRGWLSRRWIYGV